MSERPLVLLCECAGTMPGIEFGALAQELAADADVERGRQFCSREGQARIIALHETHPARRLLLAGCARDFAERRFHRLLSRGIVLEWADIREGCAWVHPDDTEATGKAGRIVSAALRWEPPAAAALALRHREDAVLVIGGGVAGTQAACELAQMGHQVRLVERRSFLGGRAARIGTVFPTNDCGQCLPTTDAQVGSRKCFHRNLAIDHPSLEVWRRTTVEAVEGRPGDFRVTLRRLPNIVTDACVDCGACEQVCPQAGEDGTGRCIHGEFYDGRVLRTVDLERCSFCGACAEACPVGAIDFTQSPERVTVKAGAILVATGCRPAPEGLTAHLGHGREGVVTQNELARMLDGWDERAARGETPVRELVMIQCAGSRDRRRLPYCSRLCCMIALKHAIRLRERFPAMKVTICYLEMRAAGVGYENWFLAARRAGVEFLRGTPPRVQFDAAGHPVVEVEDTSLGRKRELRPELVVLSSGLVPAQGTEQLSAVLGVDLDDDGFVDILDRKNRATETTREGVFVCGSAAGPKALVECTTEASAVAAEIHTFLASAGRHGAMPSEVDPERCIGCDVCVTGCPFGAVRLVERSADAVRPPRVDELAKVAEVDPQLCRACGICAATCPELAVRHNVGDETIVGRLRILLGGVARPVVGFYCRECAGAAISLGGRRRDGYPSRVRLVELPCIGRLSALHIVEAVRLGAAGVFLAGCAEGRCQYRSGDRSAAEQARQAGELLSTAGREVPIEFWHLCAVDRHGVGRRIRRFCERTRSGAEETMPDALRTATMPDALRVEEAAPDALRPATMPDAVRGEAAVVEMAAAAGSAVGAGPVQGGAL